MSMLNPRRRQRRCRDDAGVSHVEAAFASTAVVLLILLVIYAGRSSAMSTHVQTAAAAAARAASLHATPAGAAGAAQKAAAANLDSHEVNCSSFDVNVDTDNLQPGGSVIVTVHCAADFSALAPVVPPGFQRRFDARATESVDAYRGGER
jgi:Flp pilus assembly protein TadG